MIKEAILLLKEKKDLLDFQMQDSLKDIFEEIASFEEAVEFLLLLREKGYSPNELASAAKFMLRYSESIHIDKTCILDVCGTGGDKKSTFNISTVVSLVVSASGVTVAKHGNRSVSSRCGSADVLEALGVNINMDKQKVIKCLNEIDIAFLFAPNFHPIMKKVLPIRKAIGKDTIFNLLGPLINPVKLTHQLLGVFRENYAELIIYALKELGRTSALVVWGEDGLDEISLSQKTLVWELKEGKVFKYRVGPEDFGFKRAPLEQIMVKDIQENKNRVLEVLESKEGASKDIVLLNSGFALYASQKVDSVEEGIKLARVSLESGQAYKKLKLLKEYSYG